MESLEMIYKVFCNCYTKLKSKLLNYESWKFLEKKVKYLEVEMTRLGIEKYDLDALYNS